MFRAANLFAALLVASVLLPAAASAQQQSKGQHHPPTAAMVRNESDCKRQADAQKLTFTARLNFLEDCLSHKPK
jgi:hypothetical protein